MSTLQIFQRFVARILGILCAAIFVILVLDVLWGVFTREVLNNQPPWTQDIATFLLVWLSLLGGVLAYADDRHLGVDVLVSKLHPTSQKIALLTSHLCVLGFSVCVFIIGGCLLFTSRWASGQIIPSLDIPKAWFYLVLPLAGILITMLCLGKIIQITKLPVEKETSR